MNSFGYMWALQQNAQDSVAAANRQTDEWIDYYRSSWRSLSYPANHVANITFQSAINATTSRFGHKWDVENKNLHFRRKFNLYLYIYTKLFWQLMAFDMYFTAKHPDILLSLHQAVKQAREGKGFRVTTQQLEYLDFLLQNTRDRTHFFFDPNKVPSPLSTSSDGYAAKLEFDKSKKSNLDMTADQIWNRYQRVIAQDGETYYYRPNESMVMKTRMAELDQKAGFIVDVERIRGHAIEVDVGGFTNAFVR